MKYIHEDNRARVRASNEAVMNFIPQSKTEQKTYSQRFKHYMNQLEQEQRAEEDAQLKEQERRKRSMLGASSKVVT